MSDPGVGRIAAPAVGCNIVVLVDEDIARDMRVLAALADYPGADVIDCRKRELHSGKLPVMACLKCLFFLLYAVARGPRLWQLLRKEYGTYAGKWITGLRISMQSFVRAQRVAANLRCKMDGVRLIHAHDLYCGVIGAELSRLTGAELVYDAHEVEFHRNRKNSWLRTAFDVTVEKMVVDCAREVRVVNAPIAALYERIHGIASRRIRVVLNDHFAGQPCSVAAIDSPGADHAVFVYVGAGVSGRQLDHLATGATILGVPVHGFFINEVPDIAIASGWVLGARDYEDELLSLVASHRCAMWCCVDDVCLSYRLSLPNKLFQALSVGIPVVASYGSYLAEIVEKYQLGFVFNGTNLSVIVEQMKSPAFAELGARVLAFRADLRSGNVVI